MWWMVIMRLRVGVEGHFLHARVGVVERPRTVRRLWQRPRSGRPRWDRPPCGRSALPSLSPEISSSASLFSAPTHKVVKDRRDNSSRSTGCAIHQKFACRSIRRCPVTLRKLSIHPHAGDGHLVLGEGAGLIGADDGGRTEGLDRRQAADEGMAVDHLAHAQGQADGDHGRQAFGHGGDGQADGDHEHTPSGVDEPAQPSQIGEDQSDRPPAQPNPGSCPARPGALQGSGFLLDGLKHLGDQADLGVHAGADHHAAAAAVIDQRAHEGGILAVAQGNLVFQADVGVFLHRARIRRSGRLLRCAG